MHLTLLLSLAFGLESVVAGPCKSSSFTIATTATTTESLGLSSTLSTDTTKATEQSDSTTTTTLISESTFSSTVSSSVSLSDTTALSEQSELTGTTTIAISESTSLADLGSTTLVALSDISATTSTEVTSTAVSESSVSTSVLSTSDGLTSSVDASVTTSAPASTTTMESAGTTDSATTAESTTDSTLYSTQISTDTTLEATTTTTTEAPTSTTVVGEVSTTTTLLPIPTLFTLSAQGGPANGLVIHGNGLPEYSVWIGVFLTWPTNQFKYEEGTGYVLVDGNPLCALSYQGNFDFVSVIVCPTTLQFYHAPLVCDRPTDGSLKCRVAVKLYNCVTGNGGTRTCTTTDASWSNMYSSAPLYATSGTYYQLRFAAADWAHDSQVSPIGLMVSPVFT
ncbi:hypothetical protein Forpe1208_v008370 [Fusarium oxysporum f. sp. rapae]|uniref:Uncharacterized protein n=1 Tax=Fusarium oxysporum f. sp. rapae TaxID=485398 RepID=A0A8J5TS34_FUSOX|nr:hypothetical protein Forpe1208_v008370 [Fusarium oxysporum f. sp. rapae]